MSETEPEKKGWFARLRSRGTPAVETPEPIETAVAPEPEIQPETAAPVASIAASVTEPVAEKKGWLSRMRDGLSKSTKRVTESITGLFTKKKLDRETLNELEDALIQADLGVAVAARLVEKLGKERFCSPSPFRWRSTRRASRMSCWW